MSQNQLMHWATIFFFAIAAVFMQPEKIGVTTANSIQLTYTGNMGVVVESENATWWLDGVHEFYKREYQHLPDSIFQHALAGRPPFGKLKGLTFSHYHSDHFSAALTNRLIATHPSILVTGSHQVGDFISTERFTDGWNKNGIIYSDEATASRLEAYNLAHTWPSRHSAVKNIMYSLLINGLRITHLGDADPEGSAYLQTAFLNADILIIPVWFINSTKGRTILNSSAAKKIVVTHITPGEKVSCDGKFNAEMILFDKVGKTVQL